jgi:putative DNA primase/helicase
MAWNDIPEELKINGLWCNWKLTDKGKIPINTLTGKLAKSNDKSTFTTYANAIQALSSYYHIDEQGKQTGGLGLGIFNGYSAIDIDHCIDNDNISDLAKDIIDYCGSYTEYSPSGTGIRIIFKTKTPLDKSTHYINNSKLGLEIYLSDQTHKYVTITGDVLYPANIVEIDLSYILEKYMKKDITSSIIVESEFNINEYNDLKLKELWNSIAPGSGSNESELDLALCSKLAYYLKGDYFAIDKVFRSSPYYKSKDSEHLTKWEIRQDYRENTIKMAIQGIQQITANQNEFNLTDTGNAHKFVERYGNIIKYNIDNKMWMFWNGKYWQNDVYNNIKNYAEIVIEEMKLEAKGVSHEEVRKAMVKNVKRALQTSGKQAMIKEAEHLQDIPITNYNFDADNYLFNCESGIIDLRSGKIQSHNKDLMLSKYSPYEVDFKNEPKLWLEFLNEIFQNDQDIIRYIQRVLGYSMTSSTREQCMFMLIGDGSNGKSLLLDIINEALGSYAATSNVDILLEKHNGNTSNLGDVARLNGIRFVVTDEAKLGDKLNESAIKTMTSGIGKIVARFLYGNEFEFTPIMKIFMASNYKPVIRGTDHGIWRRIKVIPFNKVIPDEQQDKDLKFKLMKEMPQILGWLIKGCLLWQKVGLHEPEILKSAQHEYRSEMDVVQKWVDEVCLLDPNYKELSRTLFENFSNYVKANKEFQLSHTMFGRNMSKKFKKKVMSGVTYYMGLKLKEGNDYILTDEERAEI